jgi:hypothetical protein
MHKSISLKPLKHAAHTHMYIVIILKYEKILFNVRYRGGGQIEMLKKRRGHRLFI